MINKLNNPLTWVHCFALKPCWDNMLREQKWCSLAFLSHQMKPWLVRVALKGRLSDKRVKHWITGSILFDFERQHAKFSRIWLSWNAVSWSDHTLENQDRSALMGDGKVPGTTTLEEAVVCCWASIRKNLCAFGFFASHPLRWLPFHSRFVLRLFLFAFN